MKSIIGKKIGMTSVFDAAGKQTAVTIIEAGPCVVTQKKTVETDGYNALQIAFGDKKEKHSIKSEVSHFAKAQTSPKKVVKEIRDSELDKNVGEPSRLIFSLKVKLLKWLVQPRVKVFRVLLNVMVSMVWVNNRMVSMIVKEHRVQLVTLLMHQEYSKVCAWAAAWVRTE